MPQQKFSGLEDYLKFSEDRTRHDDQISNLAAEGVAKHTRVTYDVCVSITRKVNVSRRVLGIDPGSRKTGYGVVEMTGNKVSHVDNGVIIVDTKAPMPLRLRQIFDGLNDIVAEYRPDEVAVETVFLGKNVSSALKLGQARGVALVVAALGNLNCREFSPMEVKRAVAGTGRADKKQVQEMVRILLGLPEIAQEDASDALAVAIAASMTRELPEMLQSGTSRKRRRR